MCVLAIGRCSIINGGGGGSPIKDSMFLLLWTNKRASLMAQR